MGLYALAIGARRNEGSGIWTSTAPCFLEADSLDEAVGKGVRAVEVAMPPDQGWHNHWAKALEIPATKSEPWVKLPPYEGRIHQGCLSCPPVERQASLNTLIAVGFGVAQVTRDSVVVWRETPDEDPILLQVVEGFARADPDHDWQVELDAPLRSRTYQRHGDDLWVLVASGDGFA